MSDRILIVDDEADILELVKTVLESKGYQVLTAHNGDEAILKTKNEMPDLILLDIVMPGKSGLEICKNLKHKKKTQHIPIIMFTVLGREIDKKLTSDAGADGHFIKPFEPDELSNNVNEIIFANRQSRFSKQIGFTHHLFSGKKILFEYDPSTPYDRIVRDFILERVSRNESVVIISNKGSRLDQIVEKNEKIKKIDFSPSFLFSPIIKENADKPLTVIYDSLSDLILSTGLTTTYEFSQNALGLLCNERTTILFLINPFAHDLNTVSSIRGLFSSQISYGKEGFDRVKIA